METNLCVRACTIIWLTLIGHHVLFAQASPVGQRSNPSNWIFSDVISFDPQTIANALASDLTLANAEREASSLNDYTTLLESRVTTAYQNAGFPDVVVHVVTSNESPKVHFHIDEGPRYEMRECRVHGLEDGQAKALTSFLMSAAQVATPTPIRDRFTLDEKTQDARREPKSEGPGIWRSGLPCSFTELSELAFRHKVQQFFLDLGYAQPVFELRFERADSHVDLLVDVTALGTQTTFNSIRFEGNERNSEDELRALLGVEFPLPWTAAAQEQIYRKLWECGRFASLRIETGSRFTQEIVVLLTELSDIPSISSPLSPQGRLALQMVPEHRSTNESEEIQATIQLHDQQIHFSSSAHFFHFQWTHSHAYKPLEVLATAGQITFIDPHQRRKFTLPHMAGQIILGMYLTIEPQTLDSPYRTRYQARIRSEPSPTGTFGEVQFHCDPAWALGMTYDPLSTMKELEDSYVFSTERSSVILHKNPPEIREFRSQDLTQEGRPIAYSIQRGRGQLEQKPLEWKSRLATYEEWHVASSPVSSLIHFLVESSWNQDWTAGSTFTKTQRQQLQLAQTLLLALVDAQILSPLDEWMLQISRPKDSPWNRFEIGLTRESENSFSGGANPWLLWTQQAFERSTWPWLLSHEWALAKAGFGPITSRAVTEMLDQYSCGPIAHYLLTRALPADDTFQEARRAIARRGMMQITQERLRSDYDQLLTRADRPLLFLHQRLLAMPPEEIALLAEGLGDDQGILKNLQQAGPLQPSERPQDRFWPLAEWAWNRWGNTMVIRHYAEQFPDLFDATKSKRSPGEARGNE